MPRSRDRGTIIGFDASLAMAKLGHVADFARGAKLAGDNMDFGTELRGYRKEEVERAIQELRRELIQSNAERAEATKEIKRITAVAEDL